MASTVVFSNGAFLPGETVALKKINPTPSMPALDLAATAAASAAGAVSFARADVAGTPLGWGGDYVGVGATSTRAIWSRTKP